MEKIEWITFTDTMGHIDIKNGFFLGWNTLITGPRPYSFQDRSISKNLSNFLMKIHTTLSRFLTMLLPLKLKGIDWTKKNLGNNY